MNSSTAANTGPTVAKRVSFLRHTLDNAYRWAGALGSTCVALICVLMIVQTMGRHLGFSTGATNDVVAWLCAAAAFLTMAHAFKHGDFVRVTLVLEKVSPATRQRLELACLLVAAVAVGYLTWWACRFTFESWQFNELAQGLWAIPIWIPQMSFAAGSFLFLVAILDELVIAASGQVPTFVRLVQERHAKGDFSSDL
jgi:TRAP-type C4-dicarboxylate transport system permease small subunit